MFMLNKLINHRSLFQTVFVKRPVILHSNFDLGIQMKTLNNAKQFKNALELFDKYKANNIDRISNSTIIQALKACAEVHDLHRGSAIHHLISSRIHNDPYILTSLIHLYSKFQ